MAWRLAPACLVIGLLSGSVAVAVAEGPIYGVPPRINFTFKARLTPKVLSKHALADIRMRVDVKASMADGSQPLALHELILELDKNIAIDPAGLPPCRHWRLEDDDIRSAEMDCKDSLVGAGQAEFEISFPEQAPFSVPSEVLAFSAGGADGKAKLFLQAYLSSPVSAAVVVPVTVSKIHHGRYGLKTVAKVPKIAGGYGSITSLSLSLGRKFTYKGKRQSYLLARCPDGHLNAKGVGVFSDGSRLVGSVMRGCIPQAETPDPTG